MQQKTAHLILCESHIYQITIELVTDGLNINKKELTMFLNTRGGVGGPWSKPYVIKDSKNRFYMSSQGLTK